MKNIIIIFTLSLVVFASRSAIAGGVSLPARGVRATSVGGAFVAGAEGGNAFWYNPSRIDETSFSLEVGLVSLSAAFTPSAGAQAGTTVENQARLAPNPTFAAVLRLNDNFSIGAAAFAPYAGAGRFDEKGPQRYMLVESDQSMLLYVAVGAAFRYKTFRVGATLQNVTGRIKQRLVSSGYSGLFGHAEDPELDILQEFELRDAFTLSGNLGGSVDVGNTTFGATVQLPYRLSGKADLRVRLPSSAFFDSVSIEGDRVDLEVPFPLSVRLGVRHRFTPAFALELAMTWEDWSVQKDLRIDPRGSILLRGVPGVGNYKLPALSIQRRMQDTYSAHLGGSYRVGPDLELRGGGYFERSAFQDENFSIAQPDDNKIGVALGVGWQLGPVRFDLAGSRVFQGSRVITNSRVSQVNPTNPEQAIVVGNGKYESGYWVAGIGAEFRPGS